MKKKGKKDTSKLAECKNYVCWKPPGYCEKYCEEYDPVWAKKHQKKEEKKC